MENKLFRKQQVRKIIYGGEFTPEEQVQEVCDMVESELNDVRFISFVAMAILFFAFLTIYWSKPCYQKHCKVDHDSLVIEQTDKIIINRNALTTNVLNYYKEVNNDTENEANQR